MENTQVAIVFGAPTTRAEFEMLATGTAYWDYAQLLGLTPQRWDSVYESCYAPVVAVMGDLCEFARACGYAIFQRATLEDLRVACGHNTLVIVSAHWKGSRVLMRDFLPGWEAVFRHMLTVPSDPVGALLASRFSHIEHLLLDDIREALNIIIRMQQLKPYLPAGLDGTVAAGDLIMEAIAREMIDLAFCGALRRGNCLELFDGLHSLAQIEQVIGPDFKGVLDLSCCTSSVLATYLRMDRNDEPVIIGGDALVIPAPHLRMVHWVLAKVHPNITRYYDVRMECARALHDGFMRPQNDAEPSK